MSERCPRRGVLAAALGAGLGACGFEPMYASRDRGAGPAAAPELAGVRVALIPERNGQVLRQELQRRLEPSEPARYDLRVALVPAAEALGIRRDGSATRVRLTYTAEWRLLTTTSPVREVASGTERALDSFNIADNQFFAADAGRLAAERRLMEILAEQIANRLAGRLRGAPAA